MCTETFLSRVNESTEVHRTPHRTCADAGGSWLFYSMRCSFVFVEWPRDRPGARRSTSHAVRARAPDPAGNGPQSMQRKRACGVHTHAG
ncbi:MAG: hypothetical protein BGO98_47500 [Myxococcales bacterium 68-20]|nr:MAG: hypothetical protein BGO98_47500 [Myxococcales bacterium 68-20]